MVRPAGDAKHVSMRSQPAVVPCFATGKGTTSLVPSSVKRTRALATEGVPKKFALPVVVPKGEADEGCFCLDIKIKP
jgi:hypothetical protein